MQRECIDDERIDEKDQKTYEREERDTRTPQIKPTRDEHCRQRKTKIENILSDSLRSPIGGLVNIGRRKEYPSKRDQGNEKR